MEVDDPDEDRKQISDDQLQTLSEEIHRADLIKDRSHHLKKYPKSFLGSDVVKFFLDQGYASNVREAESLGQQLMDADLIHHVTDDHPFKNENLFYRFREDDKQKGKGPSVAKLTKEGVVAIQGELLLKGTFFLEQTVFCT